MAVSGIGGSTQFTQAQTDAKSEYSSTQRTPEAMQLPTEYYAMISEFFRQFMGDDKKIEYEENIRRLSELRSQLSSIGASMSAPPSDAGGALPDLGPIQPGEVRIPKDQLRGSSPRGEVKTEVASGIRAEIARLEQWVKDNPLSTEEPRYLKEAKEYTQGLRDASGKIIDYMYANQGLIPEAYRASSEKYSGTLSDIISGGMSGQSFQETLPEGLIDKLLSGMSVGLGDKTFGSFAPKGAADAVASIYNTRAGERTNVMGLLGELGGIRAATEVLPAQTRYQSGLAPIEKELEYATLYPTNSGFLSAMTALQNIFNPLLTTSYMMGGQFPILDSSGSSVSDSEYKSGGGDFNMGLGGGGGGTGG